MDPEVQLVLIGGAVAAAPTLILAFLQNRWAGKRAERQAREDRAKEVRVRADVEAVNVLSNSTPSRT